MNYPQLNNKEPLLLYSKVTSLCNFLLITDQFLLNTVYKLASAAIGNRIKTVLPKLINKDQSRFLAGRFIGENTRAIYDVMQLAEERNIPELLLLIDFEKQWLFCRTRQNST